MPLIEEIENDPGPSWTPGSLGPILKELSARLALPEELLESFMGGDIPGEAMDIYHDHAVRTLSEIESKVSGSGWDMLDLQDQGEIMDGVTRLYGSDPFTSEPIRQTIDRISDHIDRPAIALYLLEGPVRRLFTNPHPHLNPTNNRALSRPAGGPDAKSDFHDSSNQPFKLAPAWGCYNILSWSIAQLPDEMLESKIGLILPPTLTLMDDWDPAWRGRGCTILAGWIGRFPSELLRRMGLDRLLLDSTIHTLSLHANPPLRHVLSLGLDLINRTTSASTRADRLAEIMEKGLVSGWIYAPPGLEGREVLINIAKMLEIMCDVLQTGIIRWLKTIIPSLLGPLQFNPSPAVAPHLSANLRALICVIRNVGPTGRISRWRGQILHVCGIVAVNLRDRGIGEEQSEYQNELQDLLKDVFTELGQQCESVKQVEYPSLLKMDGAVFAPLIPA